MYITRDIAAASYRQETYKFDEMYYVVRVLCVFTFAGCCSAGSPLQAAFQIARIDGLLLV